MTPEEQAALDAAKAKEEAEALAAKEAKEAEEAEEAAKALAAKAAAAADTPEALKEALRKERKDGSKANREAQAAKKKADDLEAELQTIRDKDKSALELAEAKLKKAEQSTADLLARVDTQDRVNAARDAGVSSPYAGFAAAELAKADAETTPADFFVDFKKSHPAMFGGNGKPPGSGTGGPAAGANTKAAQIAALEAERVKIAMDTSKGFRRMEIRKQLQLLKKEGSP